MKEVTGYTNQQSAPAKGKILMVAGSLRLIPVLPNAMMLGETIRLP
jgi:hypothetical protein